MKVNFYGPLEQMLGYPIHYRSLCLALDRAGVDISMFPIYGTQNVQQYGEDIVRMVVKGQSEDVDLNAIGIKLSVANPWDMMQFGGRKRIGYTVLETSRIPDRWVKMLNQMDQAWTATKWGAKVFADCGVEKDIIRVVPEGVDTDVFRPGLDPLPEFDEMEGFKFLCIGKWENRKNQRMLIEAFCEEFKPDEKVNLILQAVNPFILRKDPTWSAYKEVFSMNLPRHAPIWFLNDFLPRVDDMARLYNSCDCFVLPTRGEGWGLPVLEAMSCGMPTIVPLITGITEYATKDSIIELNCTGTCEVEDPIFYEFTEGSEWFEPCIDSLKMRMRAVFNERDGPTVRKRIEEARKVAEKWTWDNAAKEAIKCLEELE